MSLNNVAEHLADPAAVFLKSRAFWPTTVGSLSHTQCAQLLDLGCPLSHSLLPERVVFSLIKFLEHREENDVFPTVYRANTRQQLIELASKAGMSLESISLLHHRPLFYFFAPASAVEMMLTRLLVLLKLQEIVSPVLVAVFKRKSAVASVAMARSSEKRVSAC